MQMAAGSGPSRDEIVREAMHYGHQYRGEGRVRVEVRDGKGKPWEFVALMSRMASRIEGVQP